MRKFKTGLVALVASAAMIVPATNAAASTQSVSNTASASSGCILLCFDHFLNGNKIDTDVSIAPTVTFCAVDITVLQTLSIGDLYDCGGGKKVKRTH